MFAVIRKNWSDDCPVILSVFEKLSDACEFRENFWNENNKGRSMIHLCDNIFVTDSFKFFKEIK
jgi:hypothetical protein